MSEMTDETFPTKQDAVFVEIIDRIHTQNEDIGALFMEVTGIPGSGKTAVILTFLEDILLNHPNQKCFFYDTYKSPFQFLKLPEGMWEILMEENPGYSRDISIHDRDQEGKVIDIPYKTFKDFDDLWKKATPGKCTAVFFYDQTKWISFINFLNSKSWCHVFLDEYGELFPSNSSGPLFRMIKEATDVFKDIRRCRTNIFATTQVTSDVDYRLRNKLMCVAYTYGAKPLGRSRVSQAAIDKLDRDISKGNEIWLEYGFGIFGKGRLTKIYRPRKGMNWEAHPPLDAPKVTDYMRGGVKDISEKKEKPHRKSVPPPE